MLHPIRGHARQTCFRSSCARIYTRSHTVSHDFSWSKLDLPSLDKKWQKIWGKNQLNREGRKVLGQELEKMYILPMFPYPSGDLHLGHLRVYTISDVLARFRRMQGYDVIHPIGWDAFGLPAENAAIERGIDPASWTRTNIVKMRSQLRSMNGHWDWDREVSTCDPNFYKHTQRLFLALHQRGMAYQAESLVNYDPVDKTVLANEQVDTNGCSWRSGAKVEKRMLKQWFLKISEFREQLLEGFEALEGAWPERVLAMQKNWLGKSTGSRIKFEVVGYDQRNHPAIEVFTTRPDTIFGVQYLALASTHPVVQALAKIDVELEAFLNTMTTLPPDSKVGYLVPHVRAINPLAYEESTPDATKASLPIYIAPYVVGDYGDGAVMGVPGHDTRDHAFWNHNRGDEPIRMVIAPSPDDSSVAMKNGPFVHHGYLTSHCGPYQGQSTAEAAKELTDLLQSRGLGSAAETWRLRDWLVSRQRYWGTPIPIIHCDSCGPLPVPEHQLPVELPSVESHWIKGKAGNPLEYAHDWINTSCPHCQNPAKRDTDTMDTFVDSSWYFMRFIDPNNENMLFSPNIADKVLPVDIYIGGVEHAILHLLYARFISKFIASTSLWNSKNGGEPFKQVLTQGMVHGKTYSDPSNGRFLKPNELDLSQPSNPVVLATGATASVSFEKMSKSKYNGVDPGICMSKYGADATRAHILFQAPVSEVLEWDEERISGITRWLRRIHDHIHQMSPLWEQTTALPPDDDFQPKAFFLNLSEMDSIFKKKKQSSQKQQMMPNPSIPGSQMEDINGFFRISKESFKGDKKLWHAVQSTIVKVTESYSNTFSLNTVVSDLMALTNTIIDNSQQRLEDQEKLGKTYHLEVRLNKHAIMALVQMMAPITPAFSEECWILLHPTTSHTQPVENLSDLTTTPASSPANPLPTSPDLSTVPSIFEHPFPTPDGTLELLTPRTQPCAVQINGKLKFVVEIPIPKGLDGMELETLVVDGITASEEGKRRFVGKMDVKNVRKVIVIRGGKTVNFVL